MGRRASLILSDKELGWLRGLAARRRKDHLREHRRQSERLDPHADDYEKKLDYLAARVHSIDFAGQVIVKLDAELARRGLDIYGRKEGDTDGRTN